MAKAKIALLEDNPEMALTVKEWLQIAGYEVDIFDKGVDFLRKFPHTQYDLCIFDWVLPCMDGLDVMDRMRVKAGTLPPIIFFTGRSEEGDIVRVIESGADDYIVKPASRPMLLARVNALLRRTIKPYKTEILYELGHVKIDTNQRVILLNGESVKLTDKELDLAVYFIKNEGVLLSRTHLIQVVWGYSSTIETRTLDVHVSRVSNKLKLTSEFGWKLTSIYQQGYRLVKSNESL